MGNVLLVDSPTNANNLEMEDLLAVLQQSEKTDIKYTDMSVMDEEQKRQLETILRGIFAVNQKHDADTSNFKLLISQLNSIITHPVHSQVVGVWLTMEKFNVLEQIRDILTARVSDADIQKFGLRLFGNMCAVAGGIDLMIKDNTYIHVISTLQQPLYIDNSDVMAEGFLVLGLLAKNSEEQRSLISNDRCKWCNHVTMALSELRAHVDVVENGVMSLAYLFSNSNTDEYILLKGRLQLFLELIEEHKERPSVQFYIIRLFSVLTTEQTVSAFIENGIQDHAMRNITNYPDNMELTKECYCLFKKLSYHQLSLTPFDEREEMNATSHTTNMTKLKNTNIRSVVKKQLLNKKCDDDVVVCCLYILEYLDEFTDCSGDEANIWSHYMFSVLTTHGADEDKIGIIEAACTCLNKLHEVRDGVVVTEAQCLTLIHTLNLHNEDAAVFTGCCGALAEILLQDPSYSRTLLDKGSNAKILEVMQNHPNSNNIQYVGCLFFINFQIQLPPDLRLNINFDPRGSLKELSTLFCSHQQEIVIKELCMGALTLLLREKSVIDLMREQPQIYRNILECANYYVLISYLNHIKLMFITLLATDREIAHDLLYCDNKTKGDISTLSLVINLTRRNQKYKEWVLAGLYTMGSLMNSEIDRHTEIEGVTGAISLLHELAIAHSHDLEIIKYILVAVRSFCVLSNNIKLHLVELFVPTTLTLFKESVDEKLNYIIYTFWAALGKSSNKSGNTILSAALLKAIELGDAISVQIFLELDADVNAPYNGKYPIIAAIDSHNPSIVEHILWQNVDQAQVKIALDSVTSTYSDDEAQIHILGFLLREFGFRAQDHMVDWCNLYLTSLEPHWLFIIMDLHHLHYSNPVRHGRKISVASKALDVKEQLLLTLRGRQPSKLSLEFDKWKRRDDGCVEESEELKSESPVSQSQLQSQAGFLDILHKRLCAQFLEESKEVSYRETRALKDLYTVKSSGGRRVSRPARSTGNTLRNINISNNSISCLENLGNCIPVMKRLSEVAKLNLNHNKLQGIPSSFGLFMKSVTDLDLSYNKLTSIPFCVLKMPLSSLNLSDNQILSLSDPLGEATKEVFCPTLKWLDLSNNSLEEVPLWLKSSCINLETLNLSCNSIKYLPEENFGFDGLKMLNLSKNQITSIPDPFFKGLHCLLNLDLSNNHVINVSSTFHSDLPNIRILELSNNRLKEDQIEELRQLPCISRLNLANNQIAGQFPPSDCGLSTFVSPCLTELDISRNTNIIHLVIGTDTDLPLETLRLSYTKVQVLEQEVGNLANLAELDISHTAIANLPLDIGKLTNLQQLKLEGLKDMDIPISIKRSNNIVVYLRQKLMNSRPHYRIKLFVVGLEERGKTSLCAAIIKKQRDRTPLATVGVVKTDWYYKGGTEKNLITIWDFAGQKQFYVTHQCFLTQRGVYLVVFSLQKGPEEVERIKPWLHTIQSRSPNAHVILVGTHLDCASEEELQRTNRAIQELTQQDIKDFLPIIECIHFVNALQSNNAAMGQLRDMIINVAERAEAAPADAQNKMNKRVKIMGEKVPACFLELESFVSETQPKKSNRYYPFPVLEHEELLEQLKEKDINMRDEDLENAVTFLHECGVVLHYNSYAQGLHQLYFIRPEWLSHVFAKIITIPEVQNWVKDGNLKKENMLTLLGDDIDNADLIDKLVSIMERFEIVLNLSKEEILIPSQLPDMRPEDLNPPTNSDSLERHYRMPCIPHGFWPRLITRLALFAPVGEASQTKRVMWSSGIYLESKSTMSDEQIQYFLVEGVNQSVLRIETTVCPVGLLGRIVYHIDTLVKEWYQGLLGKDIRGIPKVEYLVPCKLCKMEGITPHNFCLQELVDAGEHGDVASCSNDHQVDIGSLAPDVMLKDFGDLVIGEDDIEFNVANNLGQGTQGSVCTGSLRGEKVAVKIFGGGSAETDYEQQPHHQLRQEGCILRLLNHPSIVRFLGVVLRPRCLVMELAEYGSLDTLIKNNTLSRTFTHRVLIQVSEGLDYLHRQNIIYRDLKPQNILIVSRDMGVPMNAKLSDFGVSGLTTDEGLLSFEGTTGYMAPNITGKQVYDTSVDIFSFGILIREILTGKRVLSELIFPKQIAGAFMDGKATLLQETGWCDLTQVLNECVNPNPEERPSALQVTDILSRADTICLRSIHSLLEKCTLTEYIVLGTELWAKVRYSEEDSVKYGLAVISLTNFTVVQKIVISAEFEEFICMSSFKNDQVLLGGVGGRVVVLKTANYSVDYLSNIHISNENVHAHNILSMVSAEGLNIPLLVMGLGNGQLCVFSEEDIACKLATCHKRVTVEKNKPVTKVVCCADHLLAASHQDIYVFNQDFDKIYVFNMEQPRAQTHITKMCVVGDSVWVALHNASVVHVCRFKKDPSGRIISMEMDKRKSVDVAELLSELPQPSTDPGPSFSIFHPNVTHTTSTFGLRITCMVQGDNCVFLGLGNGMLLQVDRATYKLKLACKRQGGALRVVVPHATQCVATFGESVLDFRGNVIPNATVCSWHIGEHVESLNRYLHARKAMLKLKTRDIPVVISESNT